MVRLVLAVDRYYKGSGPAEVRVELDPSWGNTPPVAGTELILGLNQDGAILRHGPCTLRLDLDRPLNDYQARSMQLVASTFGNGMVPAGVPVPEASTRAPALTGHSALYGSLALLGLIMVGARVARRTRKRDEHSASGGTLH